jgi:hypothetical protein
MRWFFGMWLLAGCGSSTSPAHPPPATPAVSQSSQAVLAHQVCNEDKDCVIACRAKKVCCGEMCECDDVINQTWHTEIRQWEKAHCKDAGCPEADCKVPEYDHKAVCIKGRCGDEKTPWKRPDAR